MVKAEGYGPVLGAVITWADQLSITWDYDAAKSAIIMDFNCDGISYTMGAIARQDDTLTLGLAAKVTAIVDELDVRRRIDPVLQELQYGCFILQTDSPAVLWRDSVYFADEADWDAEVMAELFGCGHEAFQLLCLRLPDLFGSTVQDARLAQMSVQGSA